MTLQYVDSAHVSDAGMLGVVGEFKFQIQVEFKFEVKLSLKFKMSLNSNLKSASLI